MFLTASVVGFLTLSVSFLLMPVAGIGYLSGILFWAGLILGISMQVVLDMRRRALFARYHASGRQMQKRRNGMFSFWSNPAAKVADVGLALGIVATILVFAITKGVGYGCYICLAATVFCFCMHCVLNGRNYFHVRNKKRIQRTLEDTFASTR